MNMIQKFWWILKDLCERLLRPAPWVTAAVLLIFIFGLAIRLFPPGPSFTPLVTQPAASTVVEALPLVLREDDCMKTGVKVCTAYITQNTTSSIVSEFLRVPMSELMRLNPKLKTTIPAVSTIVVPADQ